MSACVMELTRGRWRVEIYCCIISSYLRFSASLKFCMPSQTGREWVLELEFRNL